MNDNIEIEVKIKRFNIEEKFIAVNEGADEGQSELERYSFFVGAIASAIMDILKDSK